MTSSKHTDNAIIKEIQKRYVGAKIDTKASSPNFFRVLSESDFEETAALVNPDPDGNSGFHAVSYAVFGHQEGWKQVKQMLLNTLRRQEYQATYDTFTCIAPCLSYPELWFDSYSAPQLTADTFKRAVVYLSSVPAVHKTTGTEYDKDGHVVYHRYRQVFLPFFEMDPEYILNPIVLLWHSSHFYLVERKLDPTTKKPVDFSVNPIVNSSYKAAVRNNQDVCQTDFSTIYE